MNAYVHSPNQQNQRHMPVGVCRRLAFPELLLQKRVLGGDGRGDLAPTRVSEPEFSVSKDTLK